MIISTPRAERAAARARTRARPSGTWKVTEPAAAFWARVSRSSPSPRTRASQTGSETPCSSPTSARTASSSWLTQGVPSESAPARPAIRKVARSTETVVWLWASLTTGRPALRASDLALRTVTGSRSSRGFTREDTSATLAATQGSPAQQAMRRKSLRRSARAVLLHLARTVEQTGWQARAELLFRDDDSSGLHPSGPCPAPQDQRGLRVDPGGLPIGLAVVG